MILKQATAIRKEWSRACDTATHQKPLFIKRTRDKLWLSNLETIADILAAYQFTAQLFPEPDGTVTLSLNELDLVENGETEADTRNKLGNSILEYALEYYENYALYSHTPNRKKHIPYVIKALIIDDAVSIGRSILCQDGKI